MYCPPYGKAASVFRLHLIDAGAGIKVQREHVMFGTSQGFMGLRQKGQKPAKTNGKTDVVVQTPTRDTVMSYITIGKSPILCLNT